MGQLGSAHEVQKLKVPMSIDISSPPQPFRCPDCSKLLCKGSFIGTVQVKCKRCGTLATFRTTEAPAEISPTASPMKLQSDDRASALQPSLASTTTLPSLTTQMRTGESTKTEENL